MVSELVYLLLEHVVTNDDLKFCLWDVTAGGALGCFDIDRNKYSTDYSTVLN